MKLQVAEYTLTPMTNLHVNRTVKRGGNYEVYKTHVSATTVVYGSRDRQLLHEIEKMSTYEWPADGIFVTPAIPKQPLSVMDNVETRVYNLIGPMGGILHSAVFGGKSSSHTTTNIYGTPVKKLILNGIQSGFLKEEDVARLKDGKVARNNKGGFTMDWERAQSNPSQLMSKLRSAVHHILYVSCPDELFHTSASSTIDMREIMKVADETYSGSLPGLLEIENRVKEVERTGLGRQEIAYIKACAESQYSQELLSDLHLYMYAWDYYRSILTVDGKEAIFGKGSKDPMPQFGHVEYIRPATEFTGYLICKEEDIDTVQKRFRRIMHFGTFASTNETIVKLSDFFPGEIVNVENCETVPLQYPHEMISSSLDIEQLIERTERYVVVSGKWTGEAIKVHNRCIPYDDFLCANLQLSESAAIPFNLLR